MYDKVVCKCNNKMQFNAENETYKRSTTFNELKVKVLINFI